MLMRNANLICATALLMMPAWLNAKAPAPAAGSVAAAKSATETTLMARPAAVAPIAAVTLYPNSAVIERIAQVKAGDRQIIIPDVPLAFDENSLRVESSAGIEIGDNTVVIREKTAPLIAEEKRLTQAIEAIEKKVAQYDIAIKSANMQQKFFDSYLDSLKAGRFEKTISSAELTATQKSLDTGSQKLLWQIQNATADKAEHERQLRALRADLQRIRPHINQVATIDIRLNAKTNGKVTISYQVHDAGWRAGYRANLQTESGKIRFERVARIAQRSGEDWHNVALVLSTGAPSSQVQGQTPDTWEVDIEEPQPQPVPMAAVRMQAMKAAPASPALAASAVRVRGKGMRQDALAENAAPRPLFEVAADYGEYKTQFTTAAPFSLPADGRIARVMLEAQDWAADLVAQTAPRLEQRAYLLAETSVPEGVWTAGELQVYRDDTYVGTTQFDIANNNKLELAFGRDDLIKVKLKPVNKMSGSSGLINKSKERIYHNVFALTNLHKKPMRIRVLDAAPVARNDEIQVKHKFIPEVSETNWQARQGVVRWDAAINPKQTLEFSAEYSISWPQGKTIDANMDGDMSGDVNPQ